MFVKFKSRFSLKKYLTYYKYLVNPSYSIPSNWKGHNPSNCVTTFKGFIIALFKERLVQIFSSRISFKPAKFSSETYDPIAEKLEKVSPTSS
jgi:hypothetical protein